VEIPSTVSVKERIAALSRKSSPQVSPQVSPSSNNARNAFLPSNNYSKSTRSKFEILEDEYEYLKKGLQAPLVRSIKDKLNNNSRNKYAANVSSGAFSADLNVIVDNIIAQAYFNDPVYVHNRDKIAGAYIEKLDDDLKQGKYTSLDKYIDDIKNRRKGPNSTLQLAD
jgi:hypothetical protein